MSRKRDNFFAKNSCQGGCAPCGTPKIAQTYVFAYNAPAKAGEFHEE